MEIFQVVGIGLLGTVLAVFVRERNREAAVLVSLATGVIIFIFALSRVGAVIEVLRELASYANVNMFYLTTLLKIIGIAYIAEFGAQVCKDAGESSTAAKIEFAAKVLVMVLALPIVVAILESVLRLVP
ncbi:MAG: stage III sporulation protein AD [Peptococcaceae bacterium]|jgi:stage III sporulation protein AD|nr:stage III sporulation protein AD [Peptococcaceae bacterium]MDH7525352.1 stage III sporulation protein AD [Peptococcaceae bacterium]